MLIYQALLGSWPTCDSIRDSYVPRIQEFVVKAGREAMVHTRWAIPNVEHEKALIDFVAAILKTSPNNPFLGEFGEFATRIAFHRALNSLAQLLIKIGSPGVPDFYQVSELWDLRLVDPDNRQPVDFNLQAKYLTDLMQGAVQLTDLLSNYRSGVLKMFVAQRALRFRREPVTTVSQRGSIYPFLLGEVTKTRSLRSLASSAAPGPWLCHEAAAIAPQKTMCALLTRSVRSTLVESRNEGCYDYESSGRPRGSLRIEYTLARMGAKRLWELLHIEKYVPALGALTGNQAVQMVKAGLKAIYVSGWQVAADANDAGQTYPDQSLYPADGVPNLCRKVNNGLTRRPQISR